MSALILAASLQGCIFSPKKSGGGGGPPPPDPLPLASNPQYALLRMKLAYEQRDTTAYRSVLDLNYQGTSRDFTEPDPSLQTTDVTYVDEVEHITALRLASNPGISLVDLNLGPFQTWVRFPSDELAHPEWAVIQISSPKIDISFTNGDHFVLLGGTTFDFKFAPYLNSSSPTDTLWTIIRWRETHS